MGFFKKLFALGATVAVAGGAYYVYKNKDKIERTLKAKKQNISLDLEVFNQKHHEYQTALDAQADLDEEVAYLRDYDKYYNLLKESYVNVQSDLIEAQTNNNEEAVSELTTLKETISHELAEGLSEFETVTKELSDRQEEIDAVSLEVENAKKMYEVAKENIEAHGRKYLKGIVDPVKRVAEEKFQTIDLTETTEEVNEDIEEAPIIAETPVVEEETPLNKAIDKTQDSINRLLSTLRK